MKIYREFSDYYDGAMSQGTQDGIDFQRKLQNVFMQPNGKPTDLEAMGMKLQSFMGENIRSYSAKGNSFKLRPLMVIFCGKIYPGIHVVHEWTLQERPSDTFFYDMPSLAIYLKKKNVEISDIKAKVTLFNKKEENTLESFFALSGTTRFENDLLNNKVITAVLSSLSNSEGSYFTVNLPLKEVEFFKKFDAWQAYQELSMYIGGVLAPESRPMVKIEDKYKVMEHGFDKMSFRKAPTKRHV